MDVDVVIRQIAKMQGESVETVRMEMEQALETAMRSEDPAVQAYWTQIPHSGEKCTLEEFLLYVHQMMQS